MDLAVHADCWHGRQCGMDATATHSLMRSLARGLDAARSNRGWHLASVVVALLLLACLVQAVVLHRAVVPALDSVRSIAEAKAMSRHGALSALLHRADDSPLFPATVAALHSTLEPWLVTRRDGWALAAQLAASLAIILTAPLVYLIATRMVAGRAALLAAILFCLLPEVARFGGDGISDSLGLLFFALALWGVLAAVPLGGDEDIPGDVPGEGGGSRLAPFVGGVAAAVSLLVGAEILCLVAMVAAMAIRRRWRMTSVLFLLGFSLAIGAWYVAASATAASPLLSPGLTANAPSPLPVKESSVSIRFAGQGAAIVAAAKALPRLMHYLLLPLAAWGYLVACDSRTQNANRFALGFAALYLVAATFYAARAGYLEPRHLAPLALVLLPWSGAGLMAAGDKCAGVMRVGRTATLVRWGIVGVVATACFVQSAKPLHGRRTPHRDAADWLARDAAPGDCVLDSRGWTGLHSGLTSYGFAEAATALASPHLRYLVVERHELRYASARSDLLSDLVARDATQAAEFDSPSGDPGQNVLVFRWTRHPSSHFVALEPALGLGAHH